MEVRMYSPVLNMITANARGSCPSNNLHSWTKGHGSRGGHSIGNLNDMRW